MLHSGCRIQEAVVKDWQLDGLSHRWLVFVTNTGALDISIISKHVGKLREYASLFNSTHWWH